MVMAETLASFQRAPECCLQWPLLSLRQNPLFCFSISGGDQEDYRTSDFRLGASTFILLALVLFVTITLLLSSLLLPLSTNRLLVLLSTLLHIILAVQLMLFHGKLCSCPRRSRRSLLRRILHRPWLLCMRS